MLIFRQTPLHAWIRSFLWAELSASSQLKNHPRWYSLQNIISSNFYNAFYKKKLFSSRSFFNERMLFFSMPCNNHWLFHVNDWTSLPTSRSNYHMSTLRYDEPQQIFLYFCNWSFKYSNYENEEFLNVLNRIASMYELLRYWRNYTCLKIELN